MSFTEKDKQQLKQEAKGEVAGFIICKQHGYAPGSSVPLTDSKGRVKRPYPGCEECSRTTLYWMWLNTPPSKRDEMLDELEEKIRKAVEQLEKGQWDLQLTKPKFERL